MENLAVIVSKPDVIKALERIIKEKPKLIKATKFNLRYKGHFFPPKEIIRYAAMEKGIKKKDLSNYRLIGGPPTNKYLEALGFEIVQFANWEIKRIPENEKRIARICWNENGWINPSGRNGKSNYKGSHEEKHGYGHEEWLFDTSKIIDGYHYGFLEPIRKQQSAFADNTYNVWLYTINDNTKERFWIGQIDNLYVLNKDEAERIKALYIKKGWFEEMKNQILASGANLKGFSNWKGVDLFNIRFLPKDIKLNEPYIGLLKTHPIYKQSRYSFANYNSEFDGLVQIAKGFEFKSSDNRDLDNKLLGVKTKSHIRPPKLIEITYLHEAISKNLTKKLISIHGRDNVTPEHPAGYGNSRIELLLSL